MRELNEAQVQMVSGGMSVKTGILLAMIAAVCPPVAIGAQVGYIANAK